MTDDELRGADHETVPVLLQRLDEELPLPAYARPGDAGLDLHAREKVEIAAGGRAMVATGIAVALPAGYVGLVHPRSGLAAKHGITVLNAPGTIDAGYRGEIGVVLHNSDPSSAYLVERGERIAQLLIQRVEMAELVVVDRLPGSARGGDGFGSTGIGVKGNKK